MSIAAQRLENQLLSRRRFAAPAEVVAWFGAMQAQDYLGSLWALGLRTSGAKEASVEAALAEGSVIRTHVFRGTWQYVAPSDLRWMLVLVGRRVIASAASRFRELGLDAKRLPHLLGYAELCGVICSGARRGKQSTFALLSERVPKAKALTREQALAELTRRYFQSRGPATERDFAWWSGLPLRDVREAIELVKPLLQGEIFGDQRYFRAGDALASGRGPSVHLLPAFDECLVAYQDRSAFVEPAQIKKLNAGGGMLKPALVSGGRVIGTWQRQLEKDAVSVGVRPFRKLLVRERDAVRAAAERYARFLGLPLNFT
jgi:hypothetical protein